jgi:hypothetical protein
MVTEQEQKRMILRNEPNKRQTELLNGFGGDGNRRHSIVPSCESHVERPLRLNVNNVNFILRWVSHHLVKRARKATCMAMDVLKEYLEEYAGNILIVVGIIMLVGGLLYVNLFGSIVSVFTIFFGIVCVAFGFFARIGLFYLKLRSLSGLGTVLVCVCVVFFALSVSLMEFLAVKGIVVSAQYYRGVFEGDVVSVYLYRPYFWLSLASAWIGIGTFVVGLIVKVYCYFK